MNATAADALGSLPIARPVEGAPVRASARQAGDEQPVDVSVVIPTYRRPELLERCLDALVRQDYDPARYEIIVADDAAQDGTRRQVEKLAERCAGKPRIRYIGVTATQGPAGARNRGWRLARGAVIAFTDDDTVPQPNWLREGLAAMTPERVAVAGSIEMPLPAAPTDYEMNESGLTRAEFVTANCFVRREALEAVGGFDERFTAAWREDSDLQFMLMEYYRRQSCIGRASRALVVHPVRPAPWGVSISQQKKSQFDALLYKKHPQLYRLKISATPPWEYYAIAAALAIGLAGALAGVGALAAAGFAAWAVLTGRFCARRLRRTSHAPGHVAEMLVTSAAIPLLSLYWRARGALKFRVLFV